MNHSPETGPRHRLDRKAKLTHLKRQHVVASMAFLAAAVSLHGDSGEHPHIPAFTVSVPSHTPEIDTNLDDAMHLATVSKNTSHQGEHFFPNHPVSQESKRKDHSYCKVVDMAVPRYFDDQEIQRGAHTDFALSTEAYMEAKHQLNEAGSITETQHVMTEVLGSLNITATYGKVESSVQRQPDGQMVEQFTNRAYALGMMAHLEALTLLPRELVEKRKRIDFVGSDKLRTEHEDGAELTVVGEYETSTFRKAIQVAVFGAKKETLVHEEAHAAQDAACEHFSDAQLEAEYKKALKYLRTNPETKDLELKLSNDKVFANATSEEKQQYILNGTRAGFPDWYSRENYKELMAVLGTEIIVHKGYIPRALAADQDSAILLREMVAERYQTALKHTNVQDWFAYVNTYADMPPSVANPEMIAKYHVSPLDGGDAYWNKWQDLAGTLTPALVLKGDGHGRPDEYIYDYQEGDMHTIVIRTSDMDSPLVKTAIDYLIKPPAKQGQIVQAFTIRGNSAIAVTSRPENR